LRHIAIVAVIAAALLAPALAYSLAAPDEKPASAAAQAPHMGIVLEATIRGHRVLVVSADKVPEAAKRLGLQVASAAPGYLAALARIDTE